MTITVDLVTVYHNATTYELALNLVTQLEEHEPDGGFQLVGVDNRINNRGFAAACNLGALAPETGKAPIIGFLNPDIKIHGAFIDQVKRTLNGPVVITGCRFNKAQAELDIWGVTDWVCGAAFFVKRDWFKSVHGFDKQFTWAWEETDLIRQAEDQRLQCCSIELPIEHTSPTDDPPQDVAYKQFHFAQGQKRFSRKWQNRRF